MGQSSTWRSLRSSRTSAAACRHSSGCANAYLLTLGSLILIGGSLGDIYGERRVFSLGAAAFGLFSLACALAPTTETSDRGTRRFRVRPAPYLCPARSRSSWLPSRRLERAAAIGAWTAWGANGIASSARSPAGSSSTSSPGAGSSRSIFRWSLVTLVLVRSAVAPAARTTSRRVDYLGAGLCGLGLAGVVFALIEQPRFGWDRPCLRISIGGPLPGIVSRLRAQGGGPMLHLELFGRRNFAVANLETLTMYAGLSILFFFLFIYLQQVAGLLAAGSGLTTLPVTAIMFALSRRFGALADRFGPRLFMAAGPLVAASGILLFLRTGPRPPTSSTCCRPCSSSRSAWR